jgi:hypothetical protein
MLLDEFSLLDASAFAANLNEAARPDHLAVRPPAFS